jgi:hypothetical protein
MTYTLSKVISMKKRAKYTKKISLALTGLLVGAATVLGASLLTPQAASAQTSPDQFNPSDSSTACPAGKYVKEDGSPCATSREVKLPAESKPSLIDQLVNPAITLMTAIVGVIIAISLVAAGITYSSAGGDPSKVAAAKKRITNSIIALVAYIFTFGILQWLVPGGIV